MDDKTQLRASVWGRVQGVSFRAFAQARARQLQLTGYARNKIDGSVEVLAEGQRNTLEVLLQYLHSGPPAASVEQVTYEWDDATGHYERFEIR